MTLPDVECEFPGDSARALFEFLSPEKHVGRLRVGTVVLLREGYLILGYGKITQILNLQRSKEGSDVD